MGTNYYFITRNKKLVKENFDEYELIDEPDFAYEIHLNKCSYGWRPLFQVHKCFRTFKELEQFYKEHEKDLIIKDEYGEEFDFDEYKDIIVSHGNRTPEPRKWVIDDNKFIGKCLTTVSCEPEEADIWCPYDHLKIDDSEYKARTKYNYWVGYFKSDRDFYSHNDPDYNIDWGIGEFS